jgi:hypothetical protein
VKAAVFALALTMCGGGTSLERAACDHMYGQCEWVQPAYPGYAHWVVWPTWSEVQSCTEVMERRYPNSLSVDRYAACNAP